MKKSMKHLISLVMILCLLVSASACSLGDPFKKFSKKMQEEENYKMTMSITVEGAGKITQTFYVDGKISYVPENKALMTEEYYIESIDDYSIEYRKNQNGKWEKSIEEDTDDSLNLEENDIFNPDNFEKDKDNKNTYKQKKDVIFDNFEDVVITFSNETIVIECTAMVDSVACDVKIVLSEIGEQELTLPTVE